MIVEHLITGYCSQSLHNNWVKLSGRYSTVLVLREIPTLISISWLTPFTSDSINLVHCSFSQISLMPLGLLRG